jgi:hypothetical protein
MPHFMIEHGVMLFTVAMLAAFCFKHRDPRKTRARTNSAVQLG